MSDFSARGNATRTAERPMAGAVSPGLLAVSLAAMEVHRPVPVDIWNTKGMLLLRKGEPLATLERQQILTRHQPAIREVDRREWLLAGLTLSDQVQRGTPVVPKGLQTQELSVGEQWLDLHAQLAVLLHQNVGVRDFLERFDALRRKAKALMNRYPDESLFVLVQMLYDMQLGYCASNALATAAVCHVIGPNAGLCENEVGSLFNAALTMNMGMARLQDQLAAQKESPSSAQREVIDQHPHASMHMLEQLGVTDALWLSLVRDHHEKGEGGGYPTGGNVHNTAQQLLQLADRFVARITPRKTRPGQSVRAAVRAQYLDMQRQDNALGQLLVKQLGMYLPGSYVRLANGEIAVVTRSTFNLKAPMVMAIVGKNGIPLSKPCVRDTAQPDFAIQDTVNSDEVKVRIDPTRLLGH